MPKAPESTRVYPPWDSDVRLLAWLATCVSVLFFLFYVQSGEVLLYGDAVAHINIARRVFDSKTPGLLQLGTVWLPLPHLLMIPFLISNVMWERGIGGSIPSMAAYVLGAVGMFRLVRGVLSSEAKVDGASRVAAWTAALVYAANPNLIYLQTTAMGEALYMAFFIWAVTYFSESVRGDPKALWKCGGCLAAACLTRYDGWFLAAAMAAVLVFPSFSCRNAAEKKTMGNQFERSRVLKFVLIAAAAPTLWLVYNGIIYRNPLEFENGPYSAKAIERRTESPGNPGHPGSGNPLVASLYFVKSGEANIAANSWLERLWVLLGLTALVAILRSFRVLKTAMRPARYQYAQLLFLLVPLPFYALSIAYGGVPLFVPTWWPFTHYNVRYGLQLLPAFAAALAMVVFLALRSVQQNLRLRLVIVLGAFALLMVSYASIWRAGPISLKEAQINMRSRNQLEAQLAGWLERLPPDSTLLMYLGDHVGALQQAAIPLRHVINEGNHRVWKQPLDPDGLWERALADPAQYSDYVVAFEGDPVWQAVHGRHLVALVEIHTMGQAPAILYRTR